MQKLLEKLLKTDEARGYWRDWSELQCQNPKCNWRAYRKDTKKTNPEILRTMKCPECGADLILIESTEGSIGKDLRKSVEESSIDFPQKDLDLAVWNKEDNVYKIKPEVKRKILDVINKYPDKDLVDMAAAGKSKAATIHIPGSIGTNLYVNDCDIDVHIVVSKDANFYGDINFQDKIIKWFNEHRDEIDGYIEKHPIEVFIQYNPNQDLMSTSCYDLIADKWLVGPKIMPLDYDPYEDFSNIADDLRDAVEDADKLFGELKRDVIDYTVIKNAMEQLAPEQKELFLERLKSKLEEMEKDIEALYTKRKEWVSARRETSKPTTPEEALEDVELAKKWRDTNALFKFVNRYQYLRVIKNLEKLLSDDEITDDEVDTIKGIIGVNNV